MYSTCGSLSHQVANFADLHEHLRTGMTLLNPCRKHSSPDRRTTANNMTWLKVQAPASLTLPAFTCFIGTYVCRFQISQSQG